MANVTFKYEEIIMNEDLREIEGWITFEINEKLSKDIRFRQANWEVNVRMKYPQNPLTRNDEKLFSLIIPSEVSDEWRRKILETVVNAASKY